MSNKDKERWERLAALGVKREIPTPEGEAKMSAVIGKASTVKTILLIPSVNPRNTCPGFRAGAKPGNTITTKATGEMVKHLILLFVIGGLGPQATAATAVTLPFDTYSGYFVSNKFEPDAKESFVTIRDQGSSTRCSAWRWSWATSRTACRRMPSSRMWSWRSSSGAGILEYKVEGVSLKGGMVELRYTTDLEEERVGHLRLPADRLDSQGQVYGGGVRGEWERW